VGALSAITFTLPMGLLLQHKGTQYMVTILSDNYQMPVHVSSFTALMQSVQLTANMSGRVATQVMHDTGLTK